MSHKMIVICLKIYKPYYQVRELLTLCWLTADWVADLYSQSSHLKGFSPVCCLMWSFNLSLDGRRFAHTEQVYSNNDKCLCFLIMKMKNDCMLCFIALLMDFYFGKFIGDVLTYADWTLSLLETFCHTSRIDIRHTLHRSSPRALHYNAITIEGKWFRYNGVRFTAKRLHPKRTKWRLKNLPSKLPSCMSNSSWSYNLQMYNNIFHQWNLFARLVSQLGVGHRYNSADAA